MINRQWVVASWPEGSATEATWRMVEAETPKLGSGQVLLRTKWLSVDPYMRGKLNEGAGLQIGDVMLGAGVGEVIESNHVDWRVGDIAQGEDVGWQEHAVVMPDRPGPARLNRVDAAAAPQAALSWLGMPGLTAYFAMMEVGRPRPGDTVVISAASGAVGQVAGQIAKLAGARVVGIAGSDEKLAWCRSVGFDETINHRTAGDLAAAVRRCAPAGVNVFFDGTGGVIHDAVLLNLALNARVAVVGRVATAGAVGDAGLRASSRLIATRATLQGFVVYDWWHRRDEALARLAAWGSAGALRFQEDILRGFETVPAAFVRMMRGDNLGKQLVEL